MRRRDYTETRAARELSAAEQPGPTGLLDIIYNYIYTAGVHILTMQEVGLHTNTHTQLQNGI